MSLDALLTPDRLEALAGFGYERGVRYARQGRVLTCEVKDGELAGMVAGSEVYRVRVAARGRTLASECTCPAAGQYAPLCKHAVALALHHLAAGSAPVRDARPARPVFATAGEVDAFAREHRIAHELELCADVLAPEIDAPSIAYLLRRWSIDDVGSLDRVRALVQGPELQRSVAEAARARIERAAEEVRAGIVEEGQRPHAPSAPALAPLWARLVELRREQRGAAVPRSLAAIHGGLVFDKQAIALEWHEPRKVGRDTAMFSFVPVIARLATVPRFATSCACATTACTHQLALVDAALAMLADPARTGEAETLARELLRPPWQRALAELAPDEPRVAKPVEVWWQIEHELREWTITPVVKRALKKGGTSAGQRMSASKLLDAHGDVLTDRDTQIAELLAAWSPGHRSSYPVRAFAALVGHPRVAIDDGTPIELRRAKLGFTAIEAGDHIRLEPAVDGARFSPRLLAPLLEAFAPGEPLVVIEPEHRRGTIVDVGPDARRMWSVLAKHGDTFPPESHAQLLDRLAALDRAVPIAVPEQLMGTRLVEPPTVVVRLRVTGDTQVELELEPFVRPADGAPLFPPGAGPRDVMIVRDGVRGYVRRDLGGEHAVVRGALARLPLEGAEEGPPLCFRFADTERALAVVAAVQQPPPGIEAEWIDTRPRIASSPTLAQLRVRIDRERDWFGIGGDLKVEAGRIELALVLDAVRRQQRFVRVDAGRWIELSQALRVQLEGIADRTFETRSGTQLELSPSAAPTIRALEEAGARLQVAPAWQLVTERLAASARLRPKPPAALRGTLRPYQVEGHAWLARLAAWGAGGCLADDMGLGKTVQAIALLLDRAKLGPALVLAPTSVALNWVDELKRFAPTLRPVIYGDAADRAACLAGLGRRDVLIVSYGLLARDADKLAGPRFATLVADEAQALKNPQTSRARAARALDAELKIALSGTPLENHLGELWSLFAIVFPGLLGSWDQFRARYAVPIERDNSARTREALARVIKPFLLRRTKQEVAPELPSRTEIELPVALSAEEAALYDDARLAAIAQLGRDGKKLRDEQRRFQVLAALTRLRLLASHPRLYDPTSPVASSKMQRLLELLDELRSEGHRALVFSQFTSHLALVRSELDRAGFRYLYLDGATPAAERAALIARFQRGEGDAFLISLKAGGTGINLTAADYVIHLDPWWNPAVEDQASDRAHRIGQTKPVTVYRLIARNTVEERILALHATKRALVKGVLEGSDAAARLTTKQLLELMGTVST